MAKQTFNLHTHTARCGHAEGLDVQYIQSAIQAGITVLGFSEHIPYIEMRLPTCRMFYEHKKEYISSLNNLKELYKEHLEILVGYEIEYLDEHLEYLLQMKKECDYFILGQHFKYLGYEYDCYCSDEDVMIYAKQIVSALKHNIITYVAHPDYYMLGRRTFNEYCIEASHMIAKASIQYDVPLEINLNGFHYGKKTYTMMNGSFVQCYPYPFREFWEIISSYGCKVVYGFDAHSPIAFMEEDRLQEANKILQGIQLNFIDNIKLR